MSRLSVSDSQSDRTKTIDRKISEYVQKDKDSCAILILWTGRVKVEDSWFQFYGEPCRQIPQIVRTGLRQLVSRVLRYFHPSWVLKRKDDDETAVDLVGGAGQDLGGHSSVQLGDRNIEAFFAYVSQKNILFGPRPTNDLLMEAWCSFQQNQACNKPDKDNIPPIKKTKLNLPAPTMLPMQVEAHARLAIPTEAPAMLAMQVEAPAMHITAPDLLAASTQQATSAHRSCTIWYDPYYYFM